MSLVKESQFSNLDGFKVKPEQLPNLLNDVGELRVDLDVEPENDEETELLHDGGEAKGEITIQVDDDTLHKDFAFTLPKVPGGDDQEDIDEPVAIEVEEPEEVVEVVSDPWKWTVPTFLSWLQNKMTNVPKHSGRDTAGLERAVAFLEAIDREISKAVRMDLNNEIAIEAVEKARDEIHKGIERLQERLDKVKTTKYPGKKKKKADEEQNGLVKEAKATHVGGIVVTVPLLISSLARSCINGMVSAGHDIEDVFKKLSKEYDLSKREQLELIQLLSDMNYTVRRDLGMPLDQQIDTTSSDNVNWTAQYNA